MQVFLAREFIYFIFSFISSKDTSLAKNLDQKNTEFLESLGELSEQENLELLERIKQGDKKYSYAEKKAERKQKAIEQQKAREAKEQQETKEFFDNLLEEENASTAPVSEVSNPVDINTPKLEGTAVKTHELPAGKKVHINSNPKNKVGAEISKERYEELYGKDKKARQKELNEKWDLGREVTKEEFDQIKANKKSYKEKVARQRELAEQQGGFKPLEQPLSDISASNATPSAVKNNRTIDKKGRVTVWNPDGTIKARFKRTTKQQAPEAPFSVREELPLKQENWGKVEKLEPGEALGVKEANRELYELRTKPQKNTNKLDTDNNVVESPEYIKDKYVKPEDAQPLEDLLPSDKESLAKEIEAQNITKDVPRVNLKEDLVKSTPAQRMAEKLYNERRQKTWKEKLKSRVKSLNDETQAKSMEELIYGDEKNQVKGASVKSSTAQAEANRAREMKQYEDIPASNKAEFRDPVTLEEVKIEKTKSNAGTTFSERIKKIIEEKGINPKNAYSHEKYGLAYIKEGKMKAKNRKGFIKFVESTIGDAVASEGLLKKVFTPISDVKIRLLDARNSTTNGFYKQENNTIYVYKNCKDPMKTLLHEARHALQEKIAQELKKITPRYRKLMNSGYRRGKEFTDFINDPYNRKILDKVIPLKMDLDNGNISYKEFYTQVSPREEAIFNECKRLEDRYRNCYIERDAVSFSEGDYGKKLFGKNIEQFGGLERNDSKGRKNNVGRSSRGEAYSDRYGYRENFWDRYSKENNGREELLGSRSIQDNGTGRVEAENSSRAVEGVYFPLYSTKDNS